LAVAVSSFVAVNRTEAAAALFPAVVAWIFFRGAACGWIPRDFLVEKGLVLVAATGVLFSGYGICQALGADFLSLGRERQAVSTVGNTNYAGALSAAFGVVGAALALFHRDRKTRILGDVAGGVGALHVALSKSLAGLLGFGAGAVLLAILALRGSRSRTAVALIAVLAAVAFAPFAERSLARAGDIARGQDKTSQVRLGLWKGTLRLAAAHPVLGCGAGNFRMAFPPFRDAVERRLSHEGRGVSYVEAEDPHNTWLKVLSESGPIALLALLGAGLLALAAAARSPEGADRNLAIAGAAGLVTLAVSGTFNSLSGHLPFAILAGLFAGFAAPVPEAEGASRPPWVRAAVILGAAFLALAPWPWFIADARYRDAMHTSKPDERLAHAQAAVSALPGHWRARFQIAIAWRAVGMSEGTVRAELRDILEVHPHHVPALIALSEGAPGPEEERLLRQAEEIAPEFAPIQKRLSWLDRERGDYASVRRRLGRALASSPDDADALYSMGRMWLLEGKRDEALPWIRRAASANPAIRERLGKDHPELRSDARFADLIGP
ncbi:MAG TPA: O-antigen ligase family protein, partial [Planctomycetota bacterium]|nr:O-antigen ligase family protein [Planctomycetota bacterium]